MTKKCTGVDRALSCPGLAGNFGTEVAHESLESPQTICQSYRLLQLPVDFFSAYMLTELSGKVTAESLRSPPGTCAGPRGTCSAVVLWLCTA